MAQRRNCILPPRYIYFDLGNVILSFDHAIACRQMAQAAGADTDQVHQYLFDSGVQWAYERGEMSSNAFCEQFRDRFDTTADDQTLLWASSEMFEMNAAVVPVVALLSAAGHRLGILSNTCEAHWLHVSSGRYRILSSYFEDYILSYEVGAMKPEPQIYQAAIESAGCAAGEIFFMDDRIENVAGAKKAGLDAVHFTSSHQLIQDLLARGVRFNI
jgi:putative hydrolase of the HAD superfamily